ncbi:FxSxx-COOH system tetratricopeptide repeat protein [Streptomyces sp. NBC_01102]|uniref:FxSxx-COOH system tetratricopeptide repeat protein n=1 Tax=unclassified Streptomyces TaxID=2593676 RepID=UPI0038707BBC|nr:FxSxx-COOH system tetratricopeptide repeat protein [Streptomyces sp. NBC_01102]
MPVSGRQVGAAGGQSVTISFAGFNRAWAIWIGDCLERRGVRVGYQRWDPQAGTPLEDELRNLMLAPGRILVVLSEWYFQLGPRSHEEWNRALHAVVAPDPGRFAAVSVTTSTLPGATSVFAAADLTNTGQGDAERRLLVRLELPEDPLPRPEGARPAPRYPAVPPEVWGGVPRRNTRFTGRDALLSDVYHALQDAGPGAGVVAVHGMSGVGKTQLAAEYVYRFNAEYDVVWWVPADRRALYRQKLAELAPELGLDTGAEYGERLRAVRGALRRGEPHSRWLLVVDGADEPDQISDLVPTGPGHVLITSRNTEWGEYNSSLIRVPEYDRDESVSFVRRRAPRLTEAEADELAGALGDLPLLLDQTAGWLNDSDMSVREYIQLLDNGIEGDVVKVSEDFPLAFQTAWSILLNQLKETVPEAVDLLRLCSFFAPGSIPVRLLKEMPPGDLPEQLSRLMNDPVLWNRAVGRLRQYSVVRLESHESGTEEASSGETIYLHRMVHKVLGLDMREPERGEFLDVVRRALAAADPGRPIEALYWPAYAEIVPHLKWAQVLESTDPAVQNLVLNCLRYMYCSGEYRAGIKLGERAMEAWRELLGETHPRVWDVSYHYANLLRAVGDYAVTEAMERVVVNHLREERGPQDLNHLRAATGLAADLRGLGRYDEALELSTWLLVAYRDLLGDQDSRTVNAQNNLAVSLRLLGRYEESRDLNRRTLESRRLLLKPRHRWTLLSEISYTTDLRLLGRYGEAESLQAQSAELHRNTLGKDNPQTLIAEYNLALCRYRRGDRSQAGSALTSVLERAERVLGDADPLTLMFSAGQSCFAREHADVDQARAISDRVMDGYLMMLGEDHPYLAGIRANHGLILRNVGERDQAHLLIEGALADMTRAVGENHPWTLGCAINASALRNLVGDPEAAAELTDATVTRATEVMGRTHPLTLSARIAYAADLRALRDRGRAEKIEGEALGDLASSLGAQHVHTVSARSRNRPFWDFEPQMI